MSPVVGEIELPRFPPRYTHQQLLGSGLMINGLIDSRIAL
jgi:hypothetical protein